MSISDTWERGDPYERYIGRWSRLVAPEFVRWLAVGSGKRWLDVGCGTGALSAAIVAQAAPASVVGVEPSAGFLERARANLGHGVTLKSGGAEALPLESASIDVAVSGLVLNFVPDMPSALREMRRVAVPGGTIGAYVWDYADGMQLIRHFWDAAADLDPAARKLDEAARFPLCSAKELASAFAAAGLTQVATSAVEVPTPFEDVADYWSPFLGGQGPAPAYAMSLSEDQRERLRARVAERLPRHPDGSIRLVARAWTVRATAPNDV
jgi:SAM-dependent methyltransferase